MISLLDYGFEPDSFPEGKGEDIARVTAVHKDRYALICEHGEIHGRLKTSSYYKDAAESFPTTGDFVTIKCNPFGDSHILRTLERKTKFSRNDFSGHAAGYVKTIKEQVVAANFDYVFIMQSLNHDLNQRRLERYLTLAWQSGAIPVVILTKADLIEDPQEQIDAVKKITLQSKVHAVSATTGYGLDALSEYLQPGKTLVFLGSSGVGKSSLVNAIAKENLMSVKAIREADDRGRHTTTHRQLIRLTNGVMIIDTPGMRELGLWEVTEGVKEVFSDVEAHLGKCKFSNCTHSSEPGCAVLAAICNGDLSQERWDSYQKLKKEVRFVNRKAAQHKRKSEVNTL